jgi:hypothetical protein
MTRGRNMVSERKTRAIELWARAKKGL